MLKGLDAIFSTGAGGGCGPASLPLEVLELVCAHLTLPERVAFTSCCRGLWARLDLQSSDALWGALEVHSKERELRWKKMRAIDRRWFTASLHAWLVRRGGAVRTVFLDGLVTEPALLLGCLGPRLVALRMRENEAAGEAALAAAGALTALTRLEASWCGVAALPAELGALGALRELVLAGSGLGRRPAASTCAPLAGLRALSRLDISSCGLTEVPLQLSALGALADLNLAGNEDLGEGGDEAFEPLASLRALTHLSLGRCGLLSLPTQLACLTALCDLGLGESYYLSDNGQAAFEPLLALTRLTRLKLTHCGLDRLPRQLSALSALADLNLFANPLFREGALAPLWGLRALTCLVLRNCDLRAVPAEFSTALPALCELVLGHNRELGRRGGDATFEPLKGLGARGLRLLDVRSCGLRRLSPPLMALAEEGVDVQWE